MPDKMVAHAVERNWSPSSITGNFLKISGQNRLLARKKGPPVRNSTAFADSCSSARALSCYSAKQAIEAQKQALRSATSGICNHVTGDNPDGIAQMA
jgi:hypothetical protein